MTPRSLGSRVLHTLAFAPATGLPVRHWRLIWLSIPARLLVALPLAVILIVPYLLALAVVWLMDEAGTLLGGLYVTRSPVRRRPRRSGRG